MRGTHLGVSHIQRVKLTYRSIIHVNSEYYMSAHVLLILLNELGKRDKMNIAKHFISFFCNEFNKFNNTGEQVSFCHMALKLLKNRIFGVKMSKFGHLLRNVMIDVITFPENL